MAQENSPDKEKRQGRIGKKARPDKETGKALCETN